MDEPLPMAPSPPPCPVGKGVRHQGRLSCLTKPTLVRGTRGGGGNYGEEKARRDTMQEKRHKFPLLVLILAIFWQNWPSDRLDEGHSGCQQPLFQDFHLQEQGG
jgi:hypothetical protein